MTIRPKAFELHTERSVKVVRGRNASLICSFTDPADAVYWYKHNSTGAPDDDAELVASEFLGISDPLPGIERFRITEDYRLLISDVSIADETTYSCFVVLQTGITKRGYTDLRVIVLADSDGPKIGSCNTFVPGECTYNVPTDPPEEVVFVCELCGVRPSVNLEWVRSDDRVMEQALGPLIVEKDGLYKVASILEVPESGFDYDYLCQATGDAVQNASSTKLTFEEGTVLVSGWSNTSVLGIVVGLVVFIVIAVVISLRMFLRGKHAQGEVLPDDKLVIKPDCSG
ncbi:T-cell surface protein tactile-like [Lytechinus variegatus]|uniref:T-cell surface protein tactile-like n=1 Tax=Lytechinus variegatus TaxID=7654 RepID=UPI001BB0D7D7|nr:T-cell surface protein tactile-like [Lytechinus variegatus]